MRCSCKKNGLSCSKCRSSCCTNVEKVLSSSETHDTESSDLSANKSKDSSSDDPSTEYNPVPFPSLDTPFTPPRMKNVSPLSVTETENEDSREELNENDEVSDKENIESIEVNKTTPPPEVSYSTVGDLTDYATTPMDRKLAEIFDGEYIRANDGTQLDGGIEDDKLWQDNYRRIIVYPLSQYDLPGSTLGRSFIKLLAGEIDGVRERKWNMEKVLCFMSTILQTSPDVKGSANIRKRVRQIFLDWERRNIGY